MIGEAEFLPADAPAGYMTRGECRIEVPYAGLLLVLEPDGSLVWACNHSPEHKIYIAADSRLAHLTDERVGG